MLFCLWYVKGCLSSMSMFSFKQFEINRRRGACVPDLSSRAWGNFRFFTGFAGGAPAYQICRRWHGVIFRFFTGFAGGAPAYQICRRGLAYQICRRWHGSISIQFLIGFLLLYTCILVDYLQCQGSFFRQFTTCWWILFCNPRVMVQKKATMEIAPLIVFTTE